MFPRRRPLKTHSRRISRINLWLGESHKIYDVTHDTWFNHVEGILNYKKKNCVYQPRVDHDFVTRERVICSRGDEQLAERNNRAKNATQIAWCETSHSVLHINEKSFRFPFVRRCCLCLKIQDDSPPAAEIKLEIINLQISTNRIFHSSITFHDPMFLA